MKRISLIILCLILLLCATSCRTPKKITYMQGFESGMTQRVNAPVRITVQPDDRLSIVVSSKNPELAEVFNKAVATYRIGSGQQGTTVESKVASFTVSPDGEIDYPMLGKIKIDGLDRHKVAEKIRSAIIGRDLLKDPVVTVEFLNANIAVLGDVARPGEYEITRDNLTILQALSKAGDLNITGDRTNVLVVREEAGEDKAYRVDLTDVASLMESPAYYLRQNDVIYVEPNNAKKRNSTEMGNVIYNPSIWISALSVLTSIAVIIFR